MSAWHAQLQLHLTQNRHGSGWQALNFRRQALLATDREFISRSGRRRSSADGAVTAGWNVVTRPLEFATALDRSSGHLLWPCERDRQLELCFLMEMMMRPQGGA
jgi:hypothetical protein